MNIRLGPITRVLAPGHSWCRRCDTTWAFVGERVVEYAPGKGVFALCVKCWDEATVQERLDAHLEVLFMQDAPATKREFVLRAVEAED